MIIWRLYPSGSVAKWRIVKDTKCFFFVEKLGEKKWMGTSYRLDKKKLDQIDWTGEAWSENRDFIMSALGKMDRKREDEHSSFKLRLKDSITALMGG